MPWEVNNYAECVINQYGQLEPDITSQCERMEVGEPILTKAIIAPDADGFTNLISSVDNVSAESETQVTKMSGSVENSRVPTETGSKRE